MKESVFICPVCGSSFIAEEKRLYCKNGHSFDRAKEGYVNLLLGRSGGTHGDNEMMIRARKAFLEEGHYLPLCEALCGKLKEQNPKMLFDAGCGEGWYTAEMSATLPNCKIAAVDISGAALKYAAKRLKGKGETAVASLYGLPLPSATFDAITLLFAPYCEEEYRRILKPNGRLYMAIPAKKHLWELKELLYDTPYENQVADFKLNGFEFISEEYLHFEKDFSGKTLENLFAMTPYYYRTPAAGKMRAEKKISSGETVKTQVEFHLLTYIRK